MTHGDPAKCLAVYGQILLKGLSTSYAGRIRHNYTICPRNKELATTLNKQ